MISGHRDIVDDFRSRVLHARERLERDGGKIEKMKSEIERKIDRESSRGIREISEGVSQVTRGVSKKSNGARELSLRDRFKMKGFGVVSYARAHKLSQPILSYVLSGSEMVSGKKRTKSGAVRKVYARLKADGVWIGRLPWEGGRDE